MKFITRITALIIACLIPVNASASVLGTLTDGGWASNLVENVWLQQNIYQSESKVVGQQVEYVVEYTPNSNVVPVVVTGEDIYGRRTIEEMIDYMDDNDLLPVIGINGDYFSYTTGIPMGHSVIDGILTTKEEGAQNAVGFNSDGTGFIDLLEIKTEIKYGDKTVNLENINKWRQPGIPTMYMFSDRFGDSTQTTGKGWFLIASPQSGELSIGGELLLKIDEKFEYDGNIAIPEGKYVITLDSAAGNEAALAFMNEVEIGDEITVTAEAVEDNDKWSAAEHVISSVGGRLVENGVAGTNFETGAAPRTAVGIKENGNIIFYVLDGRQPGYSYGAQLTTLAQRMIELGCVDAINFDGGGSTSLMGYFPGDKYPTLINSPSDGRLREVANFIFLRRTSSDIATPPPALTPSPTEEVVTTPSPAATAQPTQEPTIAPTSEPTAEPTAAPTQEPTIAPTPAPTPRTDPMDITIVIENGLVKATVKAEGTPINTDYVALSIDGKELTGDENLSYTQPSLDEVCITYPVESGFEHEYHSVKALAAIPDGVVNIKTLKTTGIPDSYFTDTAGHWAEGIISYMAQQGLVNGRQTESGLSYDPDSYMTRAEFAKIVLNYLEVDEESYSGVYLPYSDTDEIPQWAINTVKAVVDLGIMTGRGGEFAPNETVTRAEAFTILGRILPAKLYREDYSFADNSEIPDWAAESIGKLAGADMVSGYEDNALRPSNPVNRAEAAVMLYNIY